MLEFIGSDIGWILVYFCEYKFVSKYDLNEDLHLIQSQLSLRNK